MTEQRGDGLNSCGHDKRREIFPMVSLNVIVLLTWFEAKLGPGEYTLVGLRQNFKISFDI